MKLLAIKFCHIRYQRESVKLGLKDGETSSSWLTYKQVQSTRNITFNPEVQVQSIYPRDCVGPCQTKPSKIQALRGGTYGLTDVQQLSQAVGKNGNP